MVVTSDPVNLFEQNEMVQHRVASTSLAWYPPERFQVSEVIVKLNILHIYRFLSVTFSIFITPCTSVPEGILAT